MKNIFLSVRSLQRDWTNCEILVLDWTQNRVCQKHQVIQLLELVGESVPSYRVVKSMRILQVLLSPYK